MTWDAIVACVQRAGLFSRGEDDWCGLLIDAGEARPRRVTIKRCADSVHVIVAAQVCAIRHINPYEALRYNYVSDDWSLGIEGDVYVLARALALALLDEAQLAAGLATTVAEATRI